MIEKWKKYEVPSVSHSFDAIQENLRPYVSVIIPAFNSASTIENCLTALRNQTYPSDRFEVIVVDDASTDDTVDLASRAGAKVISVGKLGKSGARNLGAKESKGEILLFTDSDCEPVPGWIASMVAPFTSDPEIVGVKGAYWSKQTELVARFTQVEVEERYLRMARQGSINFIDTYAAGYRREIFLKNDGFDETLPEDEDQDLSFRIARQGHKMVFVPEARVYHRHTVSVKRYFQRKFSIGTWKPILINRYPERLISDSRTPQSLKMQMVLSLLLAALIIPSFFSREARRLLVFTGGIFLLVCFPFLQTARRIDRGVLTVVVPMLWVRGIALIIGYINGMIRFRGRKTI